MDFLADTSFLIDLWREAKQHGPATRFALIHRDKQVAICWTVAGEFLSGARAAGHDGVTVSTFLSRYPIIHSDAAIIRSYAAIFAALRKQNQLIGPNDLWIAAAARAVELPLLTRNVNEFRRVDDLEVIEYCTGT